MLAPQLTPLAMTPQKRLLGAASLCVLGVLGSNASQAAILNLTDETGSLSDNTPTSFLEVYDTQADDYFDVRGGGINDAYFISGDLNSGSGSFRQLYKVSGGLQESGYNRDGIMDSSVSNGFNPLIRKSDLVTTLNGQFYIFALDVNEPGSSQLLSLDDFRIYTRSGSDPNPLPDNEADLDQLGILRYNLDTGEDSTILIDAGIVGSGGGASDLLAFVPVLSLEAAADDDYIYLYSAFGGYDPDGTDAWVNDSGFEEWSVPEDASERPNVEPLEEPIPEPSTSLLLTVAAAALAMRRKR